MDVAILIGLTITLMQAQPNSALDTARDLYANAAYEEALAALSRAGEAGATNDHRLVEEYRMFSLFALGRAADAETAAAALIQSDPHGRLQSADASPRIQGMYQAVRKRVLPQLARDKYRSGRTAVEKKDFTTAARDLGEAQRLIDEARSAGVVDVGLVDLLELIDGFLVLAKSQPEKPATQVAATATTTRTPAPAVYSIDDAGVKPPQVIDQSIPDVPESLRESLRRLQRPMIVTLTIDERGAVRRSEITTAMNPVYDRLVIAASKNWRYHPATKDGVAVAYQKALAVSVAAR
jgi:hypothetical protein